MATQTYILTRKDPNIDILNAISSLEQRAEKMLALTIGLVSINFFSHSEARLAISFPFFTLSFLCYLFTFLKKPSLLQVEMSREKLYALFEQKAFKPEEIVKITEAEDKFRKKFFDSYNRKLSFIKIAHTSFLGLVLGITTAFGIETFLPDFFSDKVRLLLYFMILVLICVIFYFNLFYSEKQQIKIEKRQET